MQVIATEIPGNRYAVETSLPVGGEIKKFIAGSEAEAIRVANAWLKLYIIEKLNKWLLQRAFAYRVVGDMLRYTFALRLMDQFSWCQNLSLTNLMRFVGSRGKDILYLAPSEKSAHYKFYQNTILPVLEYCEGKELAQ